MSGRSDLPRIGPEGVPLGEYERAVAVLPGLPRWHSFELQAGAELRPATRGPHTVLVIRVRDERQPDPGRTPGRRRDDPKRRREAAEVLAQEVALREDAEKRREEAVRQGWPDDPDAPAPAEKPPLGELRQAVDPWAGRSRGMRCSTCMFYVPKVGGVCEVLEDGTPLPFHPMTIEEAEAAAENQRRAYPAKTVTVRPKLGRCRRHAPTMSGYPVVFPSDWCGEHKLDETKL